ncbi:MAG: hypothetical protein ACXVJD_03250 [Mucilaginibacter sp.]
MTSLKFNFSHPVKGRACLRRLSTGKPLSQQIVVDSNGENDFEVPLGQCEDGKYKFLLDWEYEGRHFSHLTEFLIDKQRLLYTP